MTDLTCEKCGEAPFHCSCPVHFEVGNSRPARPVPELPEGYQDDGIVLWKKTKGIHRSPLIDIDNDGVMNFNRIYPEDVPAVLVFLQRRSK